MAAVVRGGHPVHGGRGRGHGRGRRGGAAADPEPAQILTPVGFQWHFWKEGNSNKSRKPSKEEELELRIYRELEKDPRVHPDELYMYGVSAGLLHQEDNIVTMLHDVVELYNRMATTRRRYLFKKMHGAWGTEVSLMLKKIQSDSELAISLVEDIHTAKGYCPATPKVFTALPKLK